jgi:hypothetical protein
MGFWSRVFATLELPPRTQGPEGEVDGALRDGRKQGLWVEPEEFDWQLLEVRYVDGVREGPFRIWHRNTRQLRLSGTMVAGQQHGAVEGWHQGRVRFRAEKVAGKFHGAYRAFKDDGSFEYEREYRDGQLWAGPDDIELNGVVIQRGRWLDGKREGAFEANDASGEPTLRAHYDGKLDGPYRTFHAGGVVKLEGAYARGLRVGLWRWHDAKGAMVAQSDDGANWRVGEWLVPAGEADPEQWISLARAWAHLGKPTDGHWFHVEHAVDAFEDVQPAVDWLRERIRERPGPHRTTFGRGWLKHVLTDDPRGALVDGIAVDHYPLNAEQLARVVLKAPMLRVLSLFECHLEPGVEALFPPGVTWPNLEELSVVDCGPMGSLDLRDARRFPKLRRG